MQNCIEQNWIRFFVFACKSNTKTKDETHFPLVDFNAVNDGGGAAAVILLEPFHYCHSDQKKKFLFLMHYHAVSLF